MTDRDRLLALAREQLGTAEQPPGSNNVIYNTDYYGGPVSGPQFPWCCAFVWWLFWKAGLSALFCGGEKTAYCPYVVHWARTHGRWVTGDYRPGDLLLYDWDGDGAADHIGVCEAVSEGALTAIEGNCENAVRRVTRWPGSVMGAYRPEYGEDTSSAADAAPSPQGEGLTETPAQPESDLTALARAVIRGEYGNGLVRRLRLGRDYERVQAEVNRLLLG